MAIPEWMRPLAIGAIGAVGAFFVFQGQGGSSDVDPLKAVPSGAFLVATLDANALRKSPLYGALFGKEGGSSLVPTSLTRACGFDPASRVEKLAVAVPEDDSTHGEFGLAAKVVVSGDELQKCADALATGKGARAQIVKEHGFAVLDNGAGAARVGYGSNGLLVAGKGAWFGSMLAAASGETPSQKNAPAADPHASLRASLTSREGWASPTILVTAVLPRSLRDRLKYDMGGDAVMSGVLGVAQAGLAVRAGEHGGTTDVAVELVCDGDAACAAVEKLVLKKKFDWSKDFTLRFIGVGQLVDAVVVERHGDRLRATTSANADSVAALVERLVKMRSHGLGRPGADTDDAATDLKPWKPASPRPPTPDETVQAKPDAGHL